MKEITKRTLLLSIFLTLFFTPSFQQTLHAQSSTFLQSVDAIQTHGNTVTTMVYKKGKSNFLYAGGDSGNIDVFRLSDDGRLTSTQTLKLSNERGPARGIVGSKIGEKDYLFIGNKGAGAVEVFSIEDNGSLTSVFVLNDTKETYLGTVITLQVVHLKDKSFLFVGGLEKAPGLSSFEIKENGQLVHIQSVKDDEAIHTDGIIGMYTHEIRGRTYLFTGGFQDNGLSSFRVFPDGSFENINNVADNVTDRYLTGTYPVDGITLGGQHYVIVGHRHHKYYKRAEFIKRKDFIYHGDAISVFKVTDLGELVPHAVLIDDETTKISGQTRIEILKLDDTRAIVAVGTRDDKSIQICVLTADGTLTPLGALDVDYPIYYGMASAKIGGSLFILAGSVDNAVKQVFSYQVDLPTIMQPSNSNTVLRHVINIKYKDEATKEQIDEAVHDFVGLQHAIPSIIDFEWGKNNSPEGKSKGFTHCFTITFRDEKGRDAYLAHPAHLALVKSVTPVIEDVLVMDYWNK